MRYVITGCPASGTMWMARLMTALGSACGHEQVFSRDGLSPGKVEGDSSWLAIPYLGGGSLRVLHLVRNPLYVVRSLVQMEVTQNPKYWSAAYLQRHMPGIIADDSVSTALRIVARWDAEFAADTALRIEDADTGAIRRVFAELTGRPKPSSVHVNRAMAKAGVRVNSHRGHRSELTWDDVANHPDGAAVIAKAERWGYL